ncbi:MAG: hypothetical protein ACXWDO_09730 [Bacteroidia bacterium]
MELLKHDSRDEVKVQEGKPPFFNSWRGMYLLVIINLAVLVIVFSLITIYYK